MPLPPSPPPQAPPLPQRPPESPPQVNLTNVSYVATVGAGDDAAADVAPADVGACHATGLFNSSSRSTYVQVTIEIATAEQARYDALFDLAANPTLEQPEVIFNAEGSWLHRCSSLWIAGYGRQIIQAPSPPPAQPSAPIEVAVIEAAVATAVAATVAVAVAGAVAGAVGGAAGGAGAGGAGRRRRCGGRRYNRSTRLWSTALLDDVVACDGLRRDASERGRVDGMDDR